MQQQFQNQMAQRQQINRAHPQQPLQESQSQYLIQPRARDSKPQVQRPLPQFLHSTQIQNIIGKMFIFCRRVVGCSCGSFYAKNLYKLSCLDKEKPNKNSSRIVQYQFILN